MTDLLPRPDPCRGHMTAAIVAAVFMASPPAGAAGFSLIAQPRTDWPRASTATLVATVPAPSGADVAIVIDRARRGGCRALPPARLRVRHVIAVGPSSASLAGSPDDSRAVATAVVGVRAPRPGNSAIHCAWASVADGPMLPAQARVHTPRTRSQQHVENINIAPTLRLPHGLLAAFAIAGLAAAGLRPARRRSGVRRRTRGHGARRPRTVERQAWGHAERRTLHQLGLDARRGEAADARVRAVLDALVPLGWTINHGVFPAGGGDVDHVAQAPDGIVFVVETKAFAHATRAALEQAARNVRRVAALSDVHAQRCRAVLCLAGSKRTDGSVTTVNGIAVYVTSPAGLDRLLRDRPGR